MSSPNSPMLRPCSTAPTRFAPAERYETANLRPLIAALNSDPFVCSMLSAFPEVAVLLNECRQIVACNATALRKIGIVDPEPLLGLRLGEAFRCVNAARMPGGCGTSPACAVCGAVRAMIRCQTDQQPAREECHILTEPNGGVAALELEVLASPLLFQGHELLVVAARDVAAEKRRALLERSFFHDALNVAGAIRGYAETMADDPDLTVLDAATCLQGMATQLIDQIVTQRELAAAEAGRLRLRPTLLTAGAVLEELRQTYASHPLARSRPLVVIVPGVGLQLACDRGVILRVLGNLVKNALEASAPEQQVTISAEQRGDEVAFTVHNESSMSDAVREQIFQRSFSTKSGQGRGIGTFSVKLLTEEYLGGRVSFSSTRVGGTYFTVQVPVGDLAAAADASAVIPVVAADALAGRRILLAEDDPHGRRILATFIKKAGATVVEAATGREAVDAVRQSLLSGQPPDLVLMDLDMPEMDGLEATRRSREIGFGNPIVALTAAHDDDCKTAQAAGLSGRLEKPTNGAEIVAGVLSFLTPALPATRFEPASPN